MQCGEVKSSLLGQTACHMELHITPCPESSNKDRGVKYFPRQFLLSKSNPFSPHNPILNNRFTNTNCVFFKLGFLLRRI